MDTKRSADERDEAGPDAAEVESAERERMLADSPDGLPPERREARRGRVVLLVGAGVAFLGGLLTVASVAMNERGLLLAGLIVLLVGCLGGMPAIAAGVLRKREADAARRAARGGGDPPRDIV